MFLTVRGSWEIYSVLPSYDHTSVFVGIAYVLPDSTIYFKSCCEAGAYETH
jgi:hypothetical protein